MCIEPFDCSANQTLNESYILGVVVGDSLTHENECVPYFFNRKFNSTTTILQYICTIDSQKDVEPIN